MSATHGAIVVADDDAGDRVLIQKALEDCNIHGEVLFVANGEELLRHLQERVKSETRPSLVLLDLNMPRMDGREALRVAKHDPALMDIPIVVLTNSSNPLDVTGAYREGANTYFQKPMDYDGLLGLMHMVTTYWLQIAKLP